MHYERFMEHFDGANKLAIKILNNWDEEFWNAQRFGRGSDSSFSPSECLAHLIQSQQFALRFIPDRMGKGDPFVLGEPFASIITIPGARARHQALSYLNLKGARNACEKLKTWSDFGRWFAPKQKDIRDQLESLLHGIPENEFNQTLIRHPLVELQDTCQGLCHTLFVAHTYYHLGQATDRMKVLGYGHLVPFPFGTFI